MNNNIIRGFTNIDLIKGVKTGVYTDTAENRKLGRVGQKYTKDVNNEHITGVGAPELTDIIRLSRAQDEGNLDTFQLRKPFNVLTKNGIVKVTPVPVTTMEGGRFVKTMHFKVQGRQFVRLSGVAKHLGIK